MWIVNLLFTITFIFVKKADTMFLFPINASQHNKEVTPL